MVAGSSPLARGLPGEEAGLDALVGIIPARAGFTILEESTTRQRVDHPRSRGVYSFPNMICWVHWGSSPLARGLHYYPVTVNEDIRIIPARAGFTSMTSDTAARTLDHPRSRGVYRMSPRARGGEARIIPARAGFTRISTSRRSPQRDHPRSRGVYARTSVLYWDGDGSSPLARGLREDFCAILGRGWIIPARAGFTGPLCPWN